MLGPSPLESPFARWVAIGVALLLAVAGTIVVLGALRSSSGQQPAAGGTPAEGISVLAQDFSLFADPRTSAKVVLPLKAGAELHVFGRSSDGQWVAAVPRGRVDAVGWLPATLVRGAPNPTLLVYIDSLPEQRPAAPAAGPVAGPELVLVAIGSRGNRLALILANAGNAEVPGPLSVAVGDTPPTSVDLVRALAPSEVAEVVVEGEYVQRRATAAVTVSPPASVHEANTANNRLEGVVAPDLPNDIGIVSAGVDPNDGHLIVTLQNNSPIPLVGTVALGVREASGAGRSLAQVEAQIEVDAGALQPVDVRQVAHVDPRNLRITVSTDAITDANPANDSLPPR